jgi:hemerythrin superfamily protein
MLKLQWFIFIHREGVHMATPTRSKSKSTTKAQDAVSLLKADHRQVEQWFEEFESTRSAKRKQDLAANICSALKVHTEIEEEIFYPAFLKATRDKDMHHEAIVEHEGAKKLIQEIEDSDPSDDFFDSKVHVLSEMIKHHVKEEEKPDGMFAEAKKSKMDLIELGQELLSRKQDLTAESQAA